MSAVPRRLLTAEEFAALPSEALRLELVRGEITAMPPAFEDHGEVAMLLGAMLATHVRQQGLGKTYAAETGFLIAQNPDTVRAPDFAFIQMSRLPAGGPAARWVPVVPDLVGEIVSSGDRLTEVRDKVQMWLDAGVRLVWVVFPAQRVVEVWRPGQAERALRAGDTLDGEDVVPGFSVPAREIVG